MIVIYDLNTKIVLATLVSNSKNVLPGNSKFEKILPDYPGQLSFCELDFPPKNSLIGGKIEFDSGIVRRILQNDFVLYEMPEDEFNNRIKIIENEKRKKLGENFPCSCSKGSVQSFIERMIKSPYSDEDTKNRILNGSFFEKKLIPVGWWGSFTDAGGYANMNRQLIMRLHNFGIVPYIKMYPTIPQVETQVAELLEVYGDLSPKKIEHPFVYAYTPMQHERHKGKRIFFTMFETATLHPVFVDLCNKYCEEMWVPSKANKEIFESNGIKKVIKVVPLGIDEKLYFEQPSRNVNFDGFIGLYGESPETGLNSFKFVSVIQWNFRKGYDALIKSFVNTFNDKDDVCLVITTQYSKEIVMNDLEKYIPRHNNLPQVVLYNKIIPTIDMPDYYRKFNCYIHLSRGEGFSLTQIEAASCGLPVISCYHSGMTEYLNAENSYIIPCKDIEKCCSRLDSICYYYQNQMMWKVGDEQVELAGHYMKEVYEDPFKAEKRALTLCNDVIEKYTWKKSAERVSRILRET